MYNMTNAMACGFSFIFFHRLFGNNFIKQYGSQTTRRLFGSSTNGCRKYRAQSVIIQSRTLRSQPEYIYFQLSKPHSAVHNFLGSSSGHSLCLHFSTVLNFNSQVLPTYLYTSFSIINFHFIMLYFLFIL